MERSQVGTPERVRRGSGASYFMYGFELIRQPGLRTFVILPLLINMLLFGVGFYFALGRLDEMLTWVAAQLPEFLSWLNFILYPLAVISMLVSLSFIFSSVMNWIAAPFNGLLAEKVELKLTGQKLNDAGLMDIVKDLPRVFGREWKKLKYYLPRAILCLLLFIVPVFGQTLGPVVWFMFTSWMMAVQYCDYPFDNHKVPFDDMKWSLKQTRGSSFSFGMSVAVFAMIPFVNLVVMPVAICGATALWVDKYRDAYAAPLKDGL
ncbi:sulfate transporter CysZ [Paraferrimonas sedimenticola]|uniref:Sulfate transporter CysZ n=1 Tax=Paraferrimonas sedimenticola TaxID=375674 RepID=A0AA37RK65_9GAMM|nr:sulfate transporter CysZ [Paraferrimonas sedimenticola]GLP94745.1 sulfate transporter CysZ [Paraferrimonas sedimenticola]